MKNKLIIFSIFTILLLPTIIFAQTSSGNTQSQNTQSDNKSNNYVTLINPLTSDDPAVIIGNIIKGILGLTGVIALAAFVAGGVIWMTSGGNPDRVKKGRDILVWAVIGLFIVFSSYSILRYVFDVLS